MMMIDMKMMMNKNKMKTMKINNDDVMIDISKDEMMK
jgi:hypothetical protein